MKHSVQGVNLQGLTPGFSFVPLGHLLRPLIDEALREVGKEKYRQGTILIPVFVVWVVLALTLRRDLNTQAVIEWMISATRWIDLNVTVRLLSDCALSHARVALGYQVFELIFQKLTATWTPAPDFHGLVSLIFDGTTLTMPDTNSHPEEFGQPSSRRGEAAFPQLPMAALIVGASHLVLDLAITAGRGKGTGECSLVKQILERIKWTGWVVLFDAGFYSFWLAWTIHHRDQRFIMNVSNSPKLKPIKGSQRADGSCRAKIRGKVDGQRREMMVRVIQCQLGGFGRFRLITNLLDDTIDARQIVSQYHNRWEVEIAFDEIKTRPCARLRGQPPTLLRSKRSDLVKQELYGLIISYHVVRHLMQQGARSRQKQALEMSFLDRLQALIGAGPSFNWADQPRPSQAMPYLIRVIAELHIDRPRRPRVNPRVVKVKLSKFKRETKAHQGEVRDFDRDLSIIPLPNDEEAAFPRAA